MPAGKPASQAEEPDDPAAAPTAVPAVAGRTPARRIPHLAPPVSPCMLKERWALTREPRARHDNYVGVEHLTLALVAMNQAVAPPILSALGASQATLRAAILDRYRQAS